MRKLLGFILVAIVGLTCISGPVRAAGELSAGSVTAAKIAANTITAAQIAAGTITATEIATSTITADRLNVSTLSAITANMGTLTAGSITGGTIDGATINAGSGDEVVLNSSGITLTAGTGTANKIKFSSGETIHAVGGDFWLTAPTIQLVSSSTPTNVTGGLDVASGLTVVSGGVRVSSLAGGGTVSVCVDNDGDLVTGCVTPAELRVAALEQEIAELRHAIAALLARER